VSLFVEYPRFAPQKCYMIRHMSSYYNTVSFTCKVFNLVKEEYHKEENDEFFTATIKSMRSSFAQMTRVMETINFCRIMGYKKLGVAYCSGMLREGRILNMVLKQNGFETVSVGCKAGGFSVEELSSIEPALVKGLSERRDLRSPDFKFTIPEKMKSRAICNPIGQAMLINKENTDFNIVLGLCVGHDSLFLKYAQAPCTVLIVKDRMLNHNPVGDLYCREAMGTI
jgi:uncharacterized metal-binding protein